MKKFKIGFKTNIGSLVEFEFETLEEAFKYGFNALLPKCNIENEFEADKICCAFSLRTLKQKNKFNLEEINKFFSDCVKNQKEKFHEKSFKFMVVNEIEDDEFELVFDFYQEDEDRFDTASYRNFGLKDVFAYAMECLLPECSFEFNLAGNTLKYTYQADTEDDFGEDEIEYSIEAMNKYIKDFIENNETNFSNMTIRNFTQDWFELEKSMNSVMSSDSDIPF